ncbi:hypothetical protein F53441_13515 [Fusarium austroafricanum]|uniref:Uncharacterized protein n=1 Tax=Fusarium austroafricanum TaxID=2364996 RepID=A0A8H4NQV3_9HYPO|nr:hypothetical protein F53441_13515 [Fusarium austroafricanum]
MASSQLCAGEPVDFYANHGYIYEQDATIGSLVPELEKRGIAESIDGLSIAKLRLLENPRVRPILDPYLDRLDVRLCTTLGPDPHHYFVLSLESGQKDRIIVHLLSPGSQAELTENSHLDSPGSGRLTGAPASNGFIEVPKPALKQRGCPVPVQMEAGGL